MMVIAVCILLVFGLCAAFAITAIISTRRGVLHASVSVAIFILAGLGSFFLSSITGQTVEYCHWAARSGFLPPFLARALLQIAPIEATSVTFLDVQLMAILLFLCYASILMFRHLVDISRALKISRKRLLSS